ncbi:MAG: hypothetical protein PHT33_10345 [bacterium]|nr:hypothetical protein [bacterium]
MKDLGAISNPYNEHKVVSNCSIFGFINRNGSPVSGSVAAGAIALMRNRSNGLGGGFAAYGIYPGNADDYAMHIMFLTKENRLDGEKYLRERFDVVGGEEMPVNRAADVMAPPLVWRYFLKVREIPAGCSEEDYIATVSMEINTTLEGAFVFSCGKDMGVFKGVGYPEAIADYFKLDDYSGYLWTAHGRFPTNSQAWWGGAHPFGLIDWTVVHNGEISSYGTNKRFLEMHGYDCSLYTDTEVICYAADLLLRRHGLSYEEAASVLAAPFWNEIDAAANEKAAILRQVYAGLLLNGPFAIILARRGEMIGLTDRIRLRPLTAAENGDILYISSEESAIRLVSPKLDRVWTPRGGELIVGRLEERTKERAA